MSIKQLFFGKLLLEVKQFVVLLRLICMSTAAPLPEPVCPSNVPLPAPEQLPDDLQTLKRMILELLATLQQERRDKDELRHRLDLLLRRLYGPRGERFTPDQLLLFDSAASGSEESAGDQPAPPPAADDSTPVSGQRRGR